LPEVSVLQFARNSKNFGKAWIRGRYHLCFWWL